jgi:hypothetical protein
MLTCSNILLLNEQNGFIFLQKIVHFYGNSFQENESSYFVVNLIQIYSKSEFPDDFCVDIANFHRPTVR